MSHYTINARSNPELQRLAQAANRERSRTLKRWLLRLTNYLRSARLTRVKTPLHPCPR